MDEIFAQYYEDLLRAQYRVSEAVQQKLPRGTIREDFLRDIVLKRKESLRGKKGIVIKNGVQSGECDLIFYEISATTTPLGDQIMIEPRYCKLVLEVKSNATGSDFKKTNLNFKKIKEIDLDNQPLCGLFCYNIDLLKKNLMKRFANVYNEEVEMWGHDSDCEIMYPYIDFVVCLSSADQECEQNQQFFLMKDRGTGWFFPREEYPIIKNFFAVTDNLL